jgi:hypothetical protein
VLEALEELYNLFNASTTKVTAVSDRRAVWSLNAIRAHAFLRGESSADLKDLNGCYSVFGVAGRADYQSDFISKLGSVINGKIGQQNLITKVEDTRESIATLTEDMEGITNQAEANETSAKLNQLLNNVSQLAQEANRLKLSKNSSTNTDILAFEDEIQAALYELKEKWGTPPPSAGRSAQVAGSLVGLTNFFNTQPRQ